MTFNPGSRSVLTRRDLGRFEGHSLFDRVARAVCEAECLPRKELYESWEVARRVRRRFRGGTVFDLACGHGLIAHLMLILDDTSPGAVGLDVRIPESAPQVAAALLRHWPRLAGRVTLTQGPISQARLQRGDLAISAHACGPLTDAVLAVAADAGARVAVLPCCHDRDANDTAGMSGWFAPALAIDAARAVTLRDRGYHVHTEMIPAEITPQNRLLLGQPRRERYEVTRFQIHLPEVTLHLGHGERSPVLDALLDPAAPGWAFLTAWNPGARRTARPENERRQLALTREFAGRYRLFPGKGLADERGGSAELGVLVLGIPEEEARARGRSAGQAALLVGSQGEAARIVECGPEAHAAR